MSWNFKRVAGPFAGPANGVVWDGEAVVFSLMEDMRLLRFDPQTGETSEFRKYTHRVNGLAFGRDGELLGCQEGGRRLVEFARDGSMIKVDALLDGKYHNYPCDLTVDRKGRIWFTDPHSATFAFGPQFFPPLDHASVLRLQKDDRNAWALRRITFDTLAPRAILLSDDEKTLYVSECPTRAEGMRELRAYPVHDDGTVGKPTVLMSFGADHRGPQRGIEGLCADGAGNLIACGGSASSGAGPAIYVFSPDGRLAGVSPFPGDLPNRCCFGGKDRATLFVTTGDVAELRARVTAMAAKHNAHHGAMGALPDGTGGGGEHAGHDMGAMHGGGAHAGHDMGGGHAGHDTSGMHGGGGGGMIMMHSKADAADIEGGIKVIFTVAPADVAKIQAELRMHAQHLAAGTCAMKHS